MFTLPFYKGEQKMEKMLEDLQTQIIKLGEELGNLYRQVEEQTNRQRDLEQVVLQIRTSSKRKGK
jgi:ferritin-like metal-binding protein YciE